jgi:hypothetical protein
MHVIYIYINYIYIWYRKLQYIYYDYIILYLDRCCVFKKKCRIPKRRFFLRRSPDIVTQDIQKWRCQRSMVVRAVELWLTMHTLDWQRGGPNTLNCTKLLFSMDSASPWAAKIVGNELCNGSGKLCRYVGKLSRNDWELRRQLLVMFPLDFFWKISFKKPYPGSKSAHLGLWAQHGPHIPMKMTQPKKILRCPSWNYAVAWNKSFQG